MTTFLSITLNARLRPLDRSDSYEDPLQEALDEHFPGSTISGGGTLISTDGEPRTCDIDIDIEGDPQAGMALVIDALEQCGAPKGSTARLDGGEPTEFGLTEGLAIYLNGTDLPDEVYENANPNELVSRLNAALGEFGEMQSYWDGPSETALYFYGSTVAQMRELVRDVLGTTPLAAQCRLVALTGDAGPVA